jgi:hypothetical protein
MREGSAPRAVGVDDEQRRSGGAVAADTERSVELIGRRCSQEEDGDDEQRHNAREQQGTPPLRDSAGRMCAVGR